MSNAIKFTELGEITISAKATQNQASSMLLNIAVTDTGIGLSEQDKNKIFGSFQQADTSTTRKYGGTGLGLTISRSIAELIGGRVGVESELGQGSTFWFYVELNYDQHSETYPALNLSTNFSEFETESSEVNLSDCRDIKEFESKVDYLQQLLVQNNLEAEDYFSQHRPCFDQAVPQCSSQLAEYVSQCDFVNALTVVERIHEHLTESEHS